MSTLALQIAQSKDDASEVASTKAVSTSLSPVIPFTETTAEQNRIGLRFQNVLIPVGSTVQELLLELWTTSAISKLKLGIAAFNTYNAQEFAETSANISGRAIQTKGNAYEYNAVTGGFVALTGVAATNKEIEKIFKGELLSPETGTEWVSGNSLGLLLTAETTKTVKIETFDGSAAKAAKLTINYTAPSVSRAPAMML